ncbi:lens fiber membrane intrinsic protein-like isoform X3 [Pomacea canaliculata]|uniref:lens fiber membrane intrinsic protein-like isoform X3 n=1 Tax=Pomacea canaliculata TaxID=400727 RepID=UPI000D73E291|nr:lens fiber membrane intrinsic protein-like isoform X3 [Pomacea canaliculata]
MPMYIPRIPVRVAIACSGVALVFQLVAVAGTGWLMWEASGHTEEDGLFRACFDGTCLSTTNNVDWFVACQAFSILALLTIFFNVVVGVLHFFREDTSRLTLPAVALGAAAAVCVAVEVGVYADNTKNIISDSANSYGYCFFLSVDAGVLSVVTVILQVVGRVKSR